MSLQTKNKMRPLQTLLIGIELLQDGKFINADLMLKMIQRVKAGEDPYDVLYTLLRNNDGEEIIDNVFKNQNDGRKN